MPKAGMLFQVDSSLRYWIPSIRKRWHLIATLMMLSKNHIFTKFYSSYSVFNNIKAVKETIKKKVFFLLLICR
ncbi:MAG: hypothetical protein WBA71_01965 [Candidatus Humimicrobiia bacterium]